MLCLVGSSRWLVAVVVCLILCSGCRLFLWCVVVVWLSRGFRLCFFCKLLS